MPYVPFDWMRAAEEARKAADSYSHDYDDFDNEEADYEATMGTDEARQWDIDGLNLKEEEDIITDNLEDGHYIDGDEVAAIHQKYEKLNDNAKKKFGKIMDDADKEAKKAEKENNPDAYDAAMEKKMAAKAELKKTVDDLKKSRNKEVEDLCKNAPKYSIAARDMLKRKQLREKESGRPVRDIKLYRKVKGQEKLQVTIYGKNRIGELNKILRKHDESLARMKGEKAKRQVDKIGYSAKEFMQGDAEHMFKGSVAMSLHAALFLLSKLAQAGHRAAQFSLYLYALNKLNMDDAEALQKAMNDADKMGLGKAPEGREGPTFGCELPALPNERQPLPILPIDLEEPFECMGSTMQYDRAHDVMGVRVWTNDGKNTYINHVFCGTEANLRKLFEDMGKSPEEIEQALAKNAEFARNFGLDKIMVDNVKQAFLDAEASMNKGQKYEREGISGPVLAPGDVDLTEMLYGSERKALPDKENTKNEANKDDITAILNSDDGKGLADVTPIHPAQSGIEAPDILEELGGDDLSL